MKKLFTLPVVLAAVLQLHAQESSGTWNLSAGYTYDGLVHGYVYVKELNAAADTLSFNEDLNVSRWHNVALRIGRTFRNDATLTLSAEQFFLTASNRVTRNLYYNDLVLNGRAGISVRGTKVYRGLLLFEDPVTARDADFRLYYSAGLLYDAIRVKIEGQIINEGDSLNFEEDFNDQIIPVPVAGGKLQWNVCHSARSAVTLEGFGTYIPKNSIINYEYTSVNAALGYRWQSGKFFISPKGVFRHLHAREDERHHVFDITSWGANLELGLRF